MPPRETVKRWDADTPDHFEFTAKFPSSITHEKRLKDAGVEALGFLSALAPISEKVTSLVLQLPPSLSFQEARPRLDELFDVLPDCFTYPVEGRHESWFCDEAISYMRRNNRCLVWGDVAGVANTMPITSEMLYVRLIGDRSIPDSEFGRVSRDRGGAVSEWAAKLRGAKGAKLAMVMANNHYEGFGPHTADSLGMQLGRAGLSWESKGQETL